MPLDACYHLAAGCWVGLLDWYGPFTCQLQAAAFCYHLLLLFSLLFSLWNSPFLYSCWWLWVWGCFLYLSSVLGVHTTATTATVVYPVHLSVGLHWVSECIIINPRRACAARVTVLSLSVCAWVSECVCYLANSYADNVQVQSKIRIERKCGTEGFWFVDFAKNTLFKRYGVICLPQRTLTVWTASRIHQKTGDCW